MAGVVFSGVPARTGAGARAHDRRFALAAEHNNYHSQAARTAGWLVVIVISQAVWVAGWSIASLTKRSGWLAGWL